MEQTNFIVVFWKLDLFLDVIIMFNFFVEFLFDVDLENVLDSDDFVIICDFSRFYKFVSILVAKKIINFYFRSV